MAAGNVIVYQHAIGDVFDEAFDAGSTTVVVTLVSDGYTPSYSSHSSFTADISVHQLTTSGFAGRILQNVTFTKVSDSYWVFDGDDITLSASASMEAKYAVGYLQASGRPLFYMDLETGETSGVSAQEIIIRWATAANEGIFRVKNAGT